AIRQLREWREPDRADAQVLRRVDDDKSERGAGEAEAGRAGHELACVRPGFDDLAGNRNRPRQQQLRLRRAAPVPLTECLADLVAREPGGFGDFAVVERELFVWIGDCVE